MDLTTMTPAVVMLARDELEIDQQQPVRCPSISFPVRPYCQWRLWKKILSNLVSILIPICLYIIGCEIFRLGLQIWRQVAPPLTSRVGGLLLMIIGALPTLGWVLLFPILFYVLIVNTCDFWRRHKLRELSTKSWGQHRAEPSNIRINLIVTISTVLMIGGAIGIIYVMINFVQWPKPQDRFEVYKYSLIIAVYVLSIGIGISGLRLPLVIQKRRRHIRHVYSVCRSDRPRSNQTSQHNQNHGNDNNHMLFCWGLILGSLFS